MLLTPVFLVLAAIFALFAGVLRWIRNQAAKSVTSRPNIIGTQILALLQWACTLVALMAIAVWVMPLPLALPVGVMLCFLALQTWFIRRLLQSRLLGEMVQVVYHRGGSIADLLDAYGRSHASLAGARAHEAAIRVRQGSKVIAAIESAGLRVPADVLWSLTLKPGQWRGETRADDADALDSTLSARVGLMAVYLPTIVLEFVAIAMFFAVAITPTFVKMFEEFGIEKSTGLEFLDLIGRWTPLLAALIAGLYFCVAVILLLWLGGSDAAIRWVPLVGRFVRNSRRAAIFESLAATVESRLTIPEGVARLGEVAMRPAERTVLTRIAADLQAGQPWTTAMRGLWSRTEGAWIEAAAASGRLPETLRELADQIRRRDRRRADSIVSIALPVVILCLAIPVGLLCISVIGVLSSLVEHLA